jgi:MtN3 and saliva related transmembrane protein
MNAISIFGLVAGAFTIVSSLPQILKVIKSRKTADISLPMYILLVTGCLMWVVYGIVTSQIAIIIPNVIYFVFNSIILYLKIRFG